MTSTDDTTPDPATDAAPARAPRRRAAGLDGMLLPELKQIASSLGLRASGMRKGQLVEAIKAAQVGAAPAPAKAAQPEEAQPAKAQPAKAQPAEDRPAPTDATAADEPSARDAKPAEAAPADARDDRRDDQGGQQDRRARRQQAGEKQDDGTQESRDQGSNGNQGNQESGDDEQGGSRRNRRRRGRERNQDNQNQRQDTQNPRQDNQRSENQRSENQRQDNQRQDGNDRQDKQQRNDTSRQDRSEQRSRRGEPDLQILEDDVLAPCAGILDLLDNYAFVRTSGYLPGAEDVYVSMSMVRKHGLRRGDAVAGQVRQPREGERREKFNPLVRIDSVNGADPETARQRVEFGKLTPINPTERLRLETSSHELVGRTLDLLTPWGKGQRALVLAPRKAGATSVLQAVAAAVTTNNPECHVMVVLIDERPEELTEYVRSVKGEVIGSSFDRQPSDHTLVAELALERAKRLVELGHDVVLVVDGLTRLARAHHLASGAGGRGPAGVDAAAVHQAKRFFGAARNVENGGSLTIVATASPGDPASTDAAILEELEGTENAELRLREGSGDPEAFLAIDVVGSGTRREDLILGEGELAAARALRRTLTGLEAPAAADRLREQLLGSATNLELLSGSRRSTR